ncbi:unnamed protein product, partial [Ascophyllum nodosum]
RDEVAIEPPAFPGRYLRGEVPCSRNCSAVNALVWVCPLEQLDYDFYLPMFFDGIRCLEEPCKTLARQASPRHPRADEHLYESSGVCDLLSAARGSPERILPSLPVIVKAIRLAILCNNPELVIFTCGAIQELARGNEKIGEALVRYYKLFLKLLNFFVNTTKSTGDRIDYGQRQAVRAAFVNNQDIGEAVTTAVETLERHGGKNAFAHIKHCIPTCKCTRH